MGRSERAEFTVMCMVYDGNGNILVQDREKEEWPGLNFPGGHVEPGESFVRAAVRETKEETGLDIKDPVLCGLKQFQTEEGARYVVIFYKTDKFSGELCSSAEGRVFWIPRTELENYELAGGFENMVKVFESGSLSEVYLYEENGENKFELL